MNITREIVKDLLPLYVAGEASPDSSRLVEAFLREDAELATLAEALRAGAPDPSAGGAVDVESGRTALERTKTLLRRRTWLLAMALFFTGLPLSFAFGDRGLTFLLIRDTPVAGSAFLAAGLALWVAFLVNARRLRVSGL